MLFAKSEICSSDEHNAEIPFLTLFFEFLYEKRHEHLTQFPRNIFKRNFSVKHIYPDNLPLCTRGNSEMRWHKASLIILDDV